MSLSRSDFSVASDSAGFCVHKNGTALKSPQQRPLFLPTQALAEAIADEFRTQGARPDVRKMPLTQMALTTLDITAPRINEIIFSLLRYGETELVCQRADDPPALVAEQSRVWGPYLVWCEKRFGAKLLTGSGILPFQQNAEALAALRAHIETLDAFFITALSEICNTLGSLVLALAFLEKKAEASEVFEAAELDRLWQIKKWGEDPSSEARFAEMKRDLTVCETWLSLLAK